MQMEFHMKKPFNMISCFDPRPCPYPYSLKHFRSCFLVWGIRLNPCGSQKDRVGVAWVVGPPAPSSPTGQPASEAPARLGPAAGSRPTMSYKVPRRVSSGLAGCRAEEPQLVQLRVLRPHRGGVHLTARWVIRARWFASTQQRAPPVAR